MVRHAHERILLIADSRREIEPVLVSAIPSAQVTRVETFFDGIAELSGGGYTAVVAAAEPMLQHPGNVTTAFAQAVNGRLAPLRIRYQAKSQPPLPMVDGMGNISQAVTAGGEEVGNVHLAYPLDNDETAARGFLHQLSLL